MSVHGISSATNAYAAYNETAKTDTVSKTEAEKTTTDKTNSQETKADTYRKKAEMSSAERKALVQKLKADSEKRMESFRALVEKMFLQQGQKFTDTDDMWKALAKGDFTVDAETAAQAKEDISEDGYWGVEQTSQRIFDFAQSLSGGDEDKMEEMLEAFKKGFSQATKSWGQDLPEISQNTYDAVLKKFEDYKKSSDEELQ